MVRLSFTPYAVLASAYACLGCTGQDVEGAWEGQFPLNGADTCETRLETMHSFTVACDGKAIVGGGRYEWNGKSLTLYFRVLTYAGRVVRSKPEMKLWVEGHGNQLTLRQGDQIYNWKRRF